MMCIETFRQVAEAKSKEISVYPDRSPSVPTSKTQLIRNITGHISSISSIHP
jgi:hypothetical protein